jgi:ureidoacrylate peracid hydrolase
MSVLRSLKERCDPSLAGLIVVDVQNDFCSPEGACARRGMDISAGLEMMPNLYKLIDEAREVSLPIIYIQTVHSEWTDTEPWIYRKPEGADKETCREGSWGVDFFDGIEPRADERVVIKHRYSAFINTDLDTILKAKGIESVLLTGVATNVCVESTMRDAFMLDYYVTMVEDCMAGPDPVLHEGTLENTRRQFGLVASHREVVDTWDGAERKKVAPGF